MSSMRASAVGPAGACGSHAATRTVCRAPVGSSHARHTRAKHRQWGASQHTHHAIDLRRTWRLAATPGNNPAPQPSFTTLFNEPIAAEQPSDPHPLLINEDFKPTSVEQRTFSMLDFATLWISLVISITTYFLAASLVDLGMSWWQGVATVFIGNVVVLAPMVLNAHPGTKYGIPFPVLARASFGIRGANVPSMLRALVACGWFGIQTWIGGSSLHQMFQVVTGASTGAPLPLLGISGAELTCFLTFWAAQVAIIVKGIESIRVVEKYSAPVLVALAVALLAWALTTAGGFGPMLSAPSQFGPGMPKAGQFWGVFWPAITANVGYWATLSLNIPDFTRYAKSQRDQLLGQAVALPPFMALFSFVGLAVTSATVVIFGQAISDPIQLLSRLKDPTAVLISIFGLVLATLTTNIAANVVAPANAIVNLAPSRISFTAGALATAALGAIIMPWRLISSTQGFIYTWLVGYSALLGPVIGVVLADYHLLRRRVLAVSDLYSMDPKGSYWYQGGFNVAALVAVVTGVLPTLPGFLAAVGLSSGTSPLFKSIYDCAWFVGTAVSGLLYCLLMAASRPRGKAAPAVA